MSLDTTDSLVRAASAIAMHAFEEERFAGVLRQLDALEREVYDRVTWLSPSHCLAQVHHVLFSKHEFRGEPSPLPIHVYLPQVLLLQTGVAESVGLIYKALAERFQLRVDGLALPDRFCLRVRTEYGFAHIDPFHGRFLTEEESRTATLDARLPGYGIVSHEGWLRRLLARLQWMLASENRLADMEAMAELQELLVQAR
ncbi:MAG: hypothetical protein KDB14_00340 [Planctomycetales bacterium]|nr:hypothetical protein [Planctomycetales bacterium]